MKGRKMGKAEAVVFAALFIGILSVVKFGDRLAEKSLLLPVVGLVFVLAFGFLGYQVFKSWKQPDEEILSDDMQEEPKGSSAPDPRQPTLAQRRGFFFSALFMAGFLILREKQTNPGALIFSGIAVLAGCCYYLPAQIQKLRGKEGQPLFPKAKLQPEQLFQMLFGLFGVCFAAFWCYMVLSKTGFWWFCIPGIIIGGAFARLLVAGLRILFRKPRDPGEKHANPRRETEQDPWDRPDKQYPGR